MSLQKEISRYILQGVYIITVRFKEKINGMTAAWVSQVSFNPRLLGVAISSKRYTYELIKQSGFFCINVLSEDQIDLAKHFGFKSGREVNKFENVPYFDALNGSPVIKDCVAYFECEFYNECETGDHLFVTGEVRDFKVLNPDKKPLIFRWEDYF